MDVRCDNGILFGVVEEGVLEVKCRSRRCGHKAGTVVLHRFDLKTGECVESPEHSVRAYAARVENGRVWVNAEVQA